ncbi:hypothetical protein ABFV05_004699 [Capra hircus]
MGWGRPSTWKARGPPTPFRALVPEQLRLLQTRPGWCPLRTGRAEPQPPPLCRGQKVSIERGSDLPEATQPSSSSLAPELAPDCPGLCSHWPSSGQGEGLKVTVRAESHRKDGARMQQVQGAQQGLVPAPALVLVSTPRPGTGSAAPTPSTRPTASSSVLPSSLDLSSGPVMLVLWRPAEGGSTFLEDALDRGALDRDALDRDALDRGAVDQGPVDRAALDQRALDRRALDRGALDQCALDRGALDRRAVDRGAVDWGAVDQGALDQGALGRHAVDRRALDWGALDWDALHQGALAQDRCDGPAGDSANSQAVGPAPAVGEQAAPTRTPGLGTAASSGPASPQSGHGHVRAERTLQLKPPPSQETPSPSAAQGHSSCSQPQLATALDHHQLPQDF